MSALLVWWWQFRATDVSSHLSVFCKGWVRILLTATISYVRRAFSENYFPCFLVYSFLLSAVIYTVCIFCGSIFFLLTNNFQNSEQNSLKQNENFIVSCDQLADTFRAALTLLSMVSMTRWLIVWFRQLKLVKTSTLCGLILWPVARQLSFVKCLH